MLYGDRWVIDDGRDKGLSCYKLKRARGAPPQCVIDKANERVVCLPASATRRTPDGAQWGTTDQRHALTLSRTWAKFAAALCHRNSLAMLTAIGPRASREGPGACGGRKRAVPRACERACVLECARSGSVHLEVAPRPLHWPQSRAPSREPLLRNAV